MFGGSLIVGIFAALVPAIMGYKADISETLAKEIGGGPKKL